MLLGTAYKTKNANVSRSIYSGGCQLTRITNTKSSGMNIDENLTWKPHIENVCKLCSRNLLVLNNVRYFMPKNSMYQFHCFSFYHTNHMEFFYGVMQFYNMTKLFKLQKRTLRIISNSFYLSHTKPLF